MNFFFFQLIPHSTSRSLLPAGGGGSVQCSEWSPMLIQLFSEHQLHLFFSPRSLSRLLLCASSSTLPPPRGVGLCVHHTITFLVKLESELHPNSWQETKCNLSGHWALPRLLLFTKSIWFSWTESQEATERWMVSWGVGAQDCFKVRDHRHYDLTVFLCRAAGLILKGKLYRCRPSWQTPSQIGVNLSEYITARFPGTEAQEK